MPRDPRAALAALQAEAVRALVEDGPLPAGIDAAAGVRTRALLAAKRARIETKRRRARRRSGRMRR